MISKQNWDWVRVTYNPSSVAPAPVAEDSFHFPSCVTNGLSERQKKALMKVFDSACLRAAARSNNSPNSPTVPVSNFKSNQLK